MVIESLEYIRKEFTDLCFAVLECLLIRFLLINLSKSSSVSKRITESFCSRYCIESDSQNTSVREYRRMKRTRPLTNLFSQLCCLDNLQDSTAYQKEQLRNVRLLLSLKYEYWVFRHKTRIFFLYPIPVLIDLNQFLILISYDFSFAEYSLSNIFYHFSEKFLCFQRCAIPTYLLT